MTNQFYQKRALSPYQQKEYEAGQAVLVEHSDEINDVKKTSETMSAVSSIAFVILSESGAIDEVTASEHLDAFAEWEPNVDYAVGNLRKYQDVLYKCVQAHHSQVDYTPDRTAALWKQVADPREEWPEWSQPIGAHDAYKEGDKVTYDGEHWISTADNNVWKPGVYGWEKAE